MMTLRTRNSLAFVFLSLLSALSAGAQDLTRSQQLAIADCALHGGGGWVETNLYADGKVRFTYWSEPDPEATEEKDPRSIYVAFWDVTQSAGELLVFHFLRNSHQKDFFILNNQGRIVDHKGHLDVEDALWGVYTHRKLQGLLPKLKHQAAIIIPVAQVRPGTSICKTPLDFGKEKDWPW
jgi:hypothetical protein